MKVAVWILLAGLPALFARSPPALTYIPNSSVKLYQVNGDCDWTEWDATITSKTPTCKPTASQMLPKADILGDDVPVVYEMIITFGDTIGASPPGLIRDDVVRIACRAERLTGRGIQDCADTAPGPMAQATLIQESFLSF